MTDFIIHLAAIIPPLSETRPDWAKEINVTGTSNILTAIKSLSGPTHFIFASSVALFGQTQDQPPPRTVSDPIQPTDHYSHHKATCERMIKDSGVDDDFIQNLSSVVGYRRYLIALFRPLIRHILLKQSPYFKNRNR